MSKLHIEEFFEFWRMVYCPKCKESNWIYDSHSQRNYPDIHDGCECHACGNQFFVGEQKEFEIRYINELEDYGLEETMAKHFSSIKGRKNPRD